MLMKNNTPDILLQIHPPSPNPQPRPPQLWQPTAIDLELENRQLRHMLDLVGKYEESSNRKQMEAQGYLYPATSFDSDPDGDWLRFECWMAGKPIRGELKELLTKNFF